MTVGSPTDASGWRNRGVLAERMGVAPVTPVRPSVSRCRRGRWRVPSDWVSRMRCECTRPSGASAFVGMAVSLASRSLAARAATVVRHQIRVIDFATPEGTDDSLTLVVEAIDLIARVDPRVQHRKDCGHLLRHDRAGFHSPANSTAPIRIVTLSAATQRRRTEHERLPLSMQRRLLADTRMVSQ